jgi:hypothetical protein
VAGVGPNAIIEAGASGKCVPREDPGNEVVSGRTPRGRRLSRLAI